MTYRRKPYNPVYDPYEGGGYNDNRPGEGGPHQTGPGESGFPGPIESIRNLIDFLTGSEDPKPPTQYDRMLADMPRNRFTRIARNMGYDRPRLLSDLSRAGRRGGFVSVDDSNPLAFVGSDIYQNRDRYGAPYGGSLEPYYFTDPKLAVLTRAWQDYNLERRANVPGDLKGKALRQANRRFRRSTPFNRSWVERWAADKPFIKEPGSNEEMLRRSIQRA